MAIFGDSRNLYRAFERAPELERERQGKLDAGLAQLPAAALEAAANLFDLFEILPATLAAADKAEYGRLQALYGDAHPRTLALKARVAQWEHARPLGNAARARAQRALVALRQGDKAFHGFVSDGDGRPLAGLEVRLVGNEHLNEAPQATTQDDGYFRIALPAGPAGGSPGGDRPAPARATAAVVIERGGRIVYHDPAPLQIDTGSAYREYTIVLSDQDR